MIDQLQSFIETFVARMRPVDRASNQAWWDLAMTGSAEAQAAIERLSREFMELFTYPGEWEQVRDWHARRAEIGQPLLRRQLEVLYLIFARNQRTPAQIARLAALGAELDQIYNTFRGTIDGKPVSDNQILAVLTTASDPEIARDAWEASKQIGAAVAERVIEVATVRNAAARALGYRDFYAQQLALQEIDEGQLFGLLAELEAATREPFRARKAELDRQLAARYNIPVEQLRPWNYADPFFQNAPKVGAVDMDSIYQDQDIVELALLSFDAQDLDVRDILARSDLYERADKNQHAFCIHIDRSSDDVRVLCNLRQTTRWMDTMLHELGHGVYDKYLGADLPYLLRMPAHTNTTEAIAQLMGRQARRADWLEKVRGLDPEQASHFASAARREQQLGMLMLVRWVLVMAHFEQALYADPQRPDLNSVWWDLVERFQFLTRPEGRDAPDWASKLHIALAPVYYHNYMLGELTASQLEHYLEAGGESMVANPATGQALREKLFALGASYPWNETLQHVTGEPLSARYFVAQFVTA